MKTLLALLMRLFEAQVQPPCLTKIGKRRA